MGDGGQILGLVYAAFEAAARWLFSFDLLRLAVIYFAISAVYWLKIIASTLSSIYARMPDVVDERRSIDNWNNISRIENTTSLLADIPSNLHSIEENIRIIQRDMTYNKKDMSKDMENIEAELREIRFQLPLSERLP